MPNPISARSMPVLFNDTQPMRLKTASDICQSMSEFELAHQWNDGISFQFLPKNLSYCFVPKIGCTFWKRIFRYLDGTESNGGTDQNTPEVKRTNIHKAPWTNVKPRDLRVSSHREAVSQSYAFMFAREPYSRLWSAYIDKIFLPGFWNGGLAKYIVLKRGYYKKGDRLCTSDISFSEFLDGVVDIISERKSFNRHWYPLSTLCNPCQIKFDFIGKMETFSTDSEFLMTKFGIDYVVPVSNFTDHVYDEVKILTEDNFEKYRACLTNEGRARRLWRTFQLNGYLPQEAAIDKRITSDLNEVTLLKMVSEELDRTPVTKTLWAERRTNAIMNAFREVPDDTLERIQTVFDLDFRLFGYSKKPDFIYKNRKP